MVRFEASTVRSRSSLPAQAIRLTNLATCPPDRLSRHEDTSWCQACQIARPGFWSPPNSPLRRIAALPRVLRTGGAALAPVKRKRVRERLATSHPVQSRGLSTNWLCAKSSLLSARRLSVTFTNPENILEVMARVLPKEVAVSLEQRVEAWATLRQALDLIEACKVDGDPQAVFAAIEEDLRARMAVPIEPSLSETR
jgi:hypothetical protein